MAIGPQLRRSVPFKICGGQVVKHQIDLQRKQIAQVHKQLELNLLLTCQQLINRAVPLLELTHLDTDPRHSTGLALSVFAPSRDESPAAAVTDKVALQPLRQRMLTARCYQPIGHQWHRPNVRTIWSTGLVSEVKRNMLNLNPSAGDPLPTCLREARHNGARTTVQRTPFVATI